MKSSRHSIMVVDDHPIIHEALKALLASETQLSIDEVATSSAQALETLKTTTPDLIILDMSLGDANGAYLIHKVHTLYPTIPILVYSMSEERLFGERVARSGARGYVMKTSKPAVLLEGIYSVLDGNLYFTKEIMNRIHLRESGRPLGPMNPLDNLSNRELDVFELVGEGLDTLHIGERLNISKNTVDTHRINIRNKLALPNAKALDRLAYEVIMQKTKKSGKGQGS